MIEVFTSGTSHIINGITCRREIVNEFGFEHLLEEGWFLTPEECYPEKTPETADSKVIVPITPVSDVIPKAGKSDKTTTKTAIKK